MAARVSPQVDSPPRATTSIGWARVGGLRRACGGRGGYVRRRPTDEILGAVGIALYLTDATGQIRFYNEAAAELWGRRPAAGELWCGSWRLYWPDGRPMPHAEAGGMGIGLTMCKRIAESQGGRVWARAREGGGAEIGFALPLVTDPGA